MRDGIEWLQPLDFAGYSYDQVAEVCPNGVCSGSLPGSEIDLTGFWWASLYDLIPLFNSYGVKPPFSAPFQWRLADNDKALEDFDTLFYSPGLGGGQLAEGITRDESPPNKQGFRQVYTALVSEWSGACDCAYLSIAHNNELGLPSDTGVWFWRALDDSPEPPPEPPKEDGINLNGYVRTSDRFDNHELDICALVLASGKVTFSCDPQGQFSLNNLPTEPNGSVVRQVYAKGFFPKSEALWGSGLELITMERAIGCPDYNPPSTPGAFPQSAGKQHSVSGRVLVQRTDTPVCALVLANGAHTFSCDGTGYFSLSFPLDENGQFTLQTYADGFAPFFHSFDEFDYPQEVRMTRSSTCKLIQEEDTVIADGKRWVQPTLFNNLSYSDISAVCSRSTGICSGSLKGRTMSGWTWASLEDVNALFNFYIGRKELGPGPDRYEETDSEWFPAFIVDGWRPVVDSSIFLWALSRSRDPSIVEGNEVAYAPGIGDGFPQVHNLDVIDTGINLKLITNAKAHGAWFYRSL